MICPLLGQNRPDGRDAAIIDGVERRSNFGFYGGRNAEVTALNAKLKEYHAAVGLATLNMWSEIIADWMVVAGHYRRALANSNSINLQPRFGEDWVSSTCVVSIDEHAHAGAGVQSCVTAPKSLYNKAPAAPVRRALTRSRCVPLPHHMLVSIPAAASLLRPGEALMEASAFVRTLQHRQGLYVCCPEEIAARLGLISLDTLWLSAQKFKNSEYGNYMHSVHHILSYGSAAHDETAAKV
jgi:hypothetical protein